MMIRNDLRSGNCYPDLLEQLNALPFYQKNYPKSLGFEFVKRNYFTLDESYKILSKTN
jgi:anhydro-N-acetylmuramic acid kinase